MSHTHCITHAHIRTRMSKRQVIGHHQTDTPNCTCASGRTRSLAFKISANFVVLNATSVIPRPTSVSSATSPGPPPKCSAGSPGLSREEGSRTIRASVPIEALLRVLTGSRLSCGAFDNRRAPYVCFNSTSLRLLSFEPPPTALAPVPMFSERTVEARLPPGKGRNERVSVFMGPFCCVSRVRS